MIYDNNLGPGVLNANEDIYLLGLLAEVNI